MRAQNIGRRATTDLAETEERTREQPHVRGQTGTALITGPTLVVNMETERSNRGENGGEILADTRARRTLEVALLVGRRLFETGHFAFAPLSAARALPLEEVAEVVSIEEARRLLPWPLLEEAGALAAVTAVAERLAAITGDFRAHLVHLARSELNHLQAHPSTASLAAACLAYLEALPGADGLAASLRGLTGHWNAILAKRLALPQTAPVDLWRLLAPHDHDALREHTLALLAATEGLVRALCHFGEKRLLQAPLPPPRAACEDLREFEAHAAARARFLAQTTDLQTRTLARAHHALLEGDAARAAEAAAEIVDEAARYFAMLCRTERAGGAHLPRERNLALENFHYVSALGRQLALLGVDPSDARASAEALFRYAGGHGCACAELLDDEMLVIAPRLPRETLAVARLRVRHDDPGYPLSVAARESVLARAPLGAPPDTPAAGA